tara:strand:+ start:6866 stop:7225 length:360 start_codon:yes stop_codon:yes gene_type:complete
MTYLALDKTTGDLFKPEGGGVSRVTDARFIVQQVQCKLRTWLGEWTLDPSIGWINNEDFEKNFSQFDLERRARQIILGTQGVLIINTLTTTYSQRKLTLSFNASTVYGSFDLTVPWGIT